MRFPRAARAAFLLLVFAAVLSLAVTPTAFAEGSSESGGGQDPHPDAQSGGCMDGGGQDPHPTADTGGVLDASGLLTDLIVWVAGVAAR